MRKIISGMIIALLAISVSPLGFNVQPVKAAPGTIYIRASGLVDPPSAPIWNLDNTYYTFTGDISDQLVVERDNIIVNGAGHTILGADTGTGVNLTGRSNVTIKTLTIRRFSYGIFLSGSSGNMLYANRIRNNTCGIRLYAASHNNSISANTITNSTDGMVLSTSSDNSISVNTITNSTGEGINLYSSSNSNSISENVITNNYDGIVLSSSSDNSISANTITNNNDDGILLDSSSGNSISANTITNNNNGIRIYSSSGNSISANTITNNNNDGILLYYYSNSNSLCANTITNSTNDGIRLYSSSGNGISANTITNNGDDGINLGSSSGNSLCANAITNNLFGIGLSSSSSNSISANTITNNYLFGIALSSSSGNSISANTITDNGHGIYLSVSSSNFIWHNNFIDNTNQAYASMGYANTWDAGYPSGGNYWSNYVGFDLYKGPAQNVVGTDEIGDTDHTLNADNIDHYPLMNPYVALTNVTSLVVRGGDNKVWYRTYSSGVWGNWIPIAAATGDSLGAAMLGNDLHIVARNLAGTQIWHGYVNVATNVFSGWTLISGSPVSAPTLASNGAVLSLVVRGGDNKVWYRTYSGGVWGSWHSIAAATGDSLGAAMLGGNLHIVARNLAGTAIYHGYVNVATNVFSGWTLISGVPVSAPTLTSNGAVLSLVVRGGDNKVWYRTYICGIWGTWHPIASATGDSPAATMLGNNLHIVARDMSGTTIWHGYVDVTTNAFSGWTLISGHPISKPTLTS